MYRAGLESILGLTRHGDSFAIDPCIPAAWSGFSLSWQFGRARYEITVTNPQHHCRGVAEATLDGVACNASRIPLEDSDRTHHVEIVIGERPSGSAATSRRRTARV
jgi:cyclic beta-1,2-glucan synthetase